MNKFATGCFVGAVSCVVAGLIWGFAYVTAQEAVAKDCRLNGGFHYWNKAYECTPVEVSDAD